MSEGTIAWLLVLQRAGAVHDTRVWRLFYGGMVRSKNVLSMLMKNFFTISIVTVIWIGDRVHAGLRDRQRRLHRRVRLRRAQRGSTADGLLFMIFQMMFAIITPALITGAVAERMKFSAWVLFTVLWSLLVYPVVAHWAFAADGWLFASGVRDFAGGLVVHINAGIAALALVFVLGPTQGLRDRGDPAALAAADPARHRDPLVRVVRVQRRLGAGGRRHRDQRLRHHPDRGCGGRARLGGGRVAPKRQTDDAWAPPRVPSPDWWRSHRAPASSRRWPPSPSGCWRG